MARFSSTLGMKPSKYNTITTPDIALAARDILRTCCAPTYTEDPNLIRESHRIDSLGFSLIDRLVLYWLTTTSPCNLCCILQWRFTAILLGLRGAPIHYMHARAAHCLQAHAHMWFSRYLCRWMASSEDVIDVSGALEERFKRAAERMRQNTALVLSNESKLELYGFFKQVYKLKHCYILVDQQGVLMFFN